MSGIVAGIRELLLNDVHIDDAVDRFNRKYMVTLILFMLGMLTVGQFIRGDEVQCWAAPDLTDMQSEYALSICWAKGTTTMISRASWEGKDKDGYMKEALEFARPLKPEDAHPNSDAYNADRYIGPHHPNYTITITYYQWIPVILVFMAMLFHMPYIVWNIFIRRSGLPMKSLIGASREASSVQPDQGTREGYLDDIVYRLVKYMERKQKKRNRVLAGMFCLGKTSVYSVYLLTKILYLCSVSACLLLLYAFCGFHPFFSIFSHGIWVGKQILFNFAWPQSPLFPIETQCTFMSQTQGIPMARVMQCALPLNLYNDKIFAIFSLLFPFLFLISLLSCIMWMWSNSYFGRREFVRDHIEVVPESTASLLPFTENFLGRDGCFVLQLIAMNVGDFVVDQIVERLWTHFKERQATSGDQTPEKEIHVEPEPFLEPEVVTVETAHAPRGMRRGIRAEITRLFNPVPKNSLLEDPMLQGRKNKGRKAKREWGADSERGHSKRRQSRTSSASFEGKSEDGGL